MVEAQSPCKEAPVVDVGLLRQYELYRAVDACSGIPAAALLYVVQIDLKQIVTFLNIRCDVYAEGIVAVCPVTSLLSVDEYCRL